MDYIKDSVLTAGLLPAQPTGIPIILCSAAPRTAGLLRSAGYRECSLNRELAARLMRLPIDVRLSSAQQTAHSIVAASGPAVLLTDYEMLFDPRYRLDVLRLFCHMAQTTRLCVRWCGKSTADTLEYAEPQSPDYHVYRLSGYTAFYVN